MPPITLFTALNNLTSIPNLCNTRSKHNGDKKRAVVSRCLRCHVRCAWADVFVLIALTGVFYVATVASASGYVMG